MITISKQYQFDFSYPSNSIPEWSTRVDRWYQLDAFSYGLTEGYWRWKNTSTNLVSPDFIILISRTASNASDLAFVESNCTSAHRFAHTLPNVRLAPLLEVMHWKGPTLCLQMSTDYLERALREAYDLPDKYHRKWVITVEPKAWEINGNSVHLFSACFFELLTK
ncbi:MAG: hypothetical protein FJZ63_03365 [Chlamydiae bacterium]|nr:hypothetical protein [Chlamydiota bacterium]